MDDSLKQINTIDDYIDQFPAETKEKLQTLRQTILALEPDLVETIKYRMPTFIYKGKNLVHFAAYQNHIGFYPTPSAINKFSRELTGYKTSKGAIQIPLDQPLPLDLINRIVQFRVDELS